MISDTLRFWSFLGAYIPSTLCTLFSLYYLLFDRNLRQSLSNHGIIVLLLVCFVSQFTIYPWMFYYYRNENTWERSYEFCLLWAFLDWSLYIVHTVLFGWTTIERHILIFHDSWMSTKRRRILFHYAPIFVLVFGFFFFYIVAFYFAPCENHLNLNIAVCLSPCVYDYSLYSMWDYIVNQIIPTIIITVFSVGLFVRVLLRRHRLNRAIHWRRHRNMIIQALSNSAVYLTLLLPYAIVYILAHIYHLDIPVVYDLDIVTLYLSYFILLFFPIVSTLSSTGLRNRIKTLLRLELRNRRTNPTVTWMRRTLEYADTRHH